MDEYSKILYNYKISEDNLKDSYEIKINNLKKQIEEIIIEKSVKIYENKLKYSNYINPDECKELLKDWFNNMLKYCYQGDFGHKIYWNNVPENIFGEYTNPPHHWICKPKNYQKIKLSSKLELYCHLNNITINISKKPENIFWGN
jgi:hypothetical protein